MDSAATNATSGGSSGTDKNNNDGSNDNKDNPNVDICGAADPDTLCSSLPKFSLPSKCAGAVANPVCNAEEGGDAVSGNEWNQNHALSCSQMTRVVTDNGYETELESSTDKVESKLNIVALKPHRQDEDTQGSLDGNSPLGKSEIDGSLTEKSNDETGSCVYMDGYWVCNPYKSETLEKQLKKHPQGPERRRAIIETLQDLGVKVFVIDGAKTEGLSDIMKHVRKIAVFVARENTVEPYTGPVGYLRCLLYQDHAGRLFNMVLPAHTVGPLGRFKEYLDAFSCTQAMIALLILCRSFPCVADDELVMSLKPAYLSLVIGLVLTEEVGLSGLNTMMMVRAAPSLSSFYLMSPFGPDVFRKIIILLLIIGGASTGPFRTVITLAGITTACMALLANMGARAWHFLRWQPLSYNGPGAAIMAYLAAVVAGAILPFMSHRAVAVGGSGSIESIIQSAVLVMLFFAISGYDEVQKFFVLGSENCGQDLVNIVGSLWWMITFVCALFMVKTIPFRDEAPETGEQFLVEEHTSPVGYKVSQLPDYEIDPNQVLEGRSWFSLNCKFMLGIFLALSIGGAMVANTYVNWGDTVVDTIDKYVGIVKEDFGM